MVLKTSCFYSRTLSLGLFAADARSLPSFMPLYLVRMHMSDVLLL